MSRLNLGVLLLLTSLFSACSSPEKETKRWNELQVKQRTIIANYPQRSILSIAHRAAAFPMAMAFLSRGRARTCTRACACARATRDARGKRGRREY